MKVRTIDELVDSLGSNSSKRKKELISISSEVFKERHLISERSLRSAVVFSYAHWEGFVKYSAQAYLKHATYKTRPVSAYVPAIQALASRSELSVAQGASKRIAPHLNIVNLFIDNIHRSCNINAEQAIDTESNLTSDIFQNICFSIGLEYYKSWSVFGPKMDDMYRTRCAIAHGELIIPKIDHARECVKFSIDSIDMLSTEITNCAALEAYLR